MNRNEMDYLYKGKIMTEEELLESNPEVDCDACWSSIPLGEPMFTRSGFVYCSAECAGVEETVLEINYFEYNSKGI